MDIRSILPPKKDKGVQIGCESCTNKNINSDMYEALKLVLEKMEALLYSHEKELIQQALAKAEGKEA